MAEIIVSAIAEAVLDKLITLASDEVSLAWGVKNDVEELRDTLKTIKAVLLDAEEKQIHNQKLRVWLEKLKEVCYDAEDVLDEVEVEDLRKQVVNRQSITKKVSHFCSSSNPVVFRFTLGHKIKEINKRLAKIAADKKDYNLTDKTDSNHVIIWDREPDSFAPDVIGRDEDKKKIIKSLLQLGDGNENVSVISIVGIGGLGKTTLANWVKDDKLVSGHFNLRMSVWVSDEFSVKKLLIKIIKSVTGQESTDRSLDQLQRELRYVIRGKRYLLVLDDVWNEVHELWSKLKRLLTDCARGSKILVTTRSERVAETMDSVFTHKLEGLALDQCLSIFVKCAFKEGQEKQHPKLIEIGEEIVKKCGGVPLAVRALGGLLHSITSEREWINVRDNEVWELDQKENMILSALRISYNKLSPPLKQCFVYCSLFPKDFEINSGNLVDFWMVHGLLHARNENEDLGDIGMQYINELMSRSFFQDFKEDCNGGYTFKIHDLMHDVATSLCLNECLAVKGNNQTASKTSYRHLFFHGFDVVDVVAAPNFMRSLSNVRSVIFSSMIGECITINQSFLKLLTSRFQFLRMLDLYNLHIEVVPKGIGKLKHLRYLKLRRNPIKKLPSSIYKLQNLQYLSLLECEYFEGLPREVKYLISLRRFNLTTAQKHLPRNGIGCLKSLRHLMISRCWNLESLCEDIGHLRALRSLWIAECPRLISLPCGVRNLSLLEDLRITICNRVSLELSTGSDNHDEPNVTGPPLRYLQIMHLPQLVELPQWLLQCSTNTLGEVIISRCPELSSLPEDMNCLISLRKLKIQFCPKLTGRCKPETGEDWTKIAHIPMIQLDREIIKSTEN